MFPYLTLFQNGLPVEFPYTEKRNLKNILDFLTFNVFESRLTKLESKEEITEKKKEFDMFVVFEKNHEFNESQSFAKNFPDVPMFYFDSKELKKEFHLPDNRYNFAIFRNFDEGDRFFALEGGVNLLVFKDIMEKFRWPAIMEITPKTVDFVLINQHNTMVFVAAAYPDISNPANDTSENQQLKMKIQEENKRAFREFMGYASKNMSFRFFKVFEESEMAKKFLDSAGRSHIPNQPFVVMLNFETQPMSKYRFETRISKESLNSWVNEFNLGRLKEAMKSEKIPLYQDTVLTRIVGINFEEEVIQKEGHVFVFLYSMFCPRSRRAMHLLREVAIKSENWGLGQEIRWNVFEVTKNEAESIKYIQDYPQLLLFKEGRKAEPIWYQGNFKEKHLENFTNLMLLGEKKYDEDL